MMILLCELAIKSEGIRFRLLWTINNLPKNLTFRAQIPSSGPVFSTGAMGRIPITFKYFF